MRIPMDVTIGSGESEYDELDFYYGAKALEGTSEVVNLVAQTILNQRLVKQVPSVEGIRSRLKKSFVGSFGQRFELEIFGSDQLKVFEYLGEDGFFELFQYYIGQAIGVDYPVSKRVAVSWDKSYIEDDVELIQRIREPLIRMHKPVESQGYKVSLRKRRSSLIVFNRASFEYISHEVTEPEKTVMKAVITRFNKLTGTGRLILDEEAPSVSFSPARQWKTFPVQEKKSFSRNLDRNNGSEEFAPLKLEVSRVIGTRGIVKHYRVHRVLLD